ncbi:MAG: hypothetical protein AB2L20_07505 [Mangrovibacterium sp.]
MRVFFIYKGLQKPLVFKGFKGRYMYWAAGFVILGLVLAGMIGAVFNLVAGIVIMAVVAGGGICYTAQKQKNGLYDKRRDKGIYVFHVNLRGIRHVKKESI